MENILQILNSLENNVKLARDSENKSLFLKVIFRAREKEKEILSQNKFICEGFVIEISDLSFKVYQNNKLVEFYFVEDKAIKVFFTNTQASSLFYVQKTVKQEEQKIDAVTAERIKASELLKSINFDKTKNKPKEEQPKKEQPKEEQPKQPVEQKPIVFEKRSYKGFWITMAVCLVLVVAMSIYVFASNGTPAGDWQINNSDSSLNNNISQTQTYSMVEDYLIVTDYFDDRLVYNPNQGKWETHLGVDVTSNTNTTIYCPFNNGVVEQFGSSITINFEDKGFKIIISHLDSDSIDTSKTVYNAGDEIGVMSSEFGFCPSSGVYACIQVMVNGEYVNPMQYNLLTNNG